MVLGFFAPRMSSSSSHRRNAVPVCMWILSEAFQFHTIHKLAFYFIFGKLNVVATSILHTIRPKMVPNTDSTVIFSPNNFPVATVDDRLKLLLSDLSICIAFSLWSRYGVSFNDISVEHAPGNYFWMKKGIIIIKRPFQSDWQRVRMEIRNGEINGSAIQVHAYAVSAFFYPKFSDNR